MKEYSKAKEHNRFQEKQEEAEGKVKVTDTRKNRKDQYRE